MVSVSFLLSGGTSEGTSGLGTSAAGADFLREAMSDILAHGRLCRNPLAQLLRVAILPGMAKREPVRQPALSELANVWVKLGHRERLVVVKVAERLLMGQKAYGELTKGKKRWRKEAAEEHLDATVYMASELIDALEEE